MMFPNSQLNYSGSQKNVNNFDDLSLIVEKLKISGKIKLKLRFWYLRSVSKVLEPRL